MPDLPSGKVRVRRPCRISTDERGRSVWADPVGGDELELVSTQMLKVILTSRNDRDREAIRQAAHTDAEGVLVRDPASGGFEIIDDDELQAILDVNQGLPRISRPDDATLAPLRDYADGEGLSLVSAHALRKVLGGEEGDGEPPVDPAAFDPYANC